MATDKKSIDWYNNNAQYFTDHVKNPNDSILHSYYEKPAMYDLLPDLNGKEVLSIGCGPGEDSQHLKAQGARRSVGIDISQELIKIARQNHPDCEFEVMDMEHLMLPDSSFDFAFSSLALHYIEDWTRTMSEVHRVLKPGSFYLASAGHPVFTAMKVTERSKSKTRRELTAQSNKTSDTMEIVGDYLTHRIADDDGWDVTSWHKPIGEMVAEIRAAGFEIDALVEPKPLEEMKSVKHRNYEMLSKIPYFVIFKLYKRE